MCYETVVYRGFIINSVNSMHYSVLLYHVLFIHSFSDIYIYGEYIRINRCSPSSGSVDKHLASFASKLA